MKGNSVHTKPVGIWIRVSTEDQAQGDSPKHHEERAREYAKFNSWKVAEVYDLAGVSGKSVMEHPEARRMMADVKRGHISGLIFSKLARLARNTKELLEFADYFKLHNADMISLQEKIDTSCPAGRFFYTMIAAMAQWEREEIGDRVRASIKIRAKLGKPLGGPAPYGYMWKDKKLVVSPAEASVRKRLYELYAQHKRRKRVAKELNDMGYRTRGGGRFTDTTILRMIEDTTAKGLYRGNHTYRDGKGKIFVKPESEWVLTPVEPIVSEELWETCNAMLNQRRHRKPLGPKPVHLFAGLLYCGCGHKMYVFSHTPKYVCGKCKNKVPIEEMETIFKEELKDFFVSKDNVEAKLRDANLHLAERKRHLDAHTAQLEKVRSEMRKTYQLYQADQLTPEGFGKLYKPLEEQETALASEQARLQGEVDALSMRQVSAEEVVHEATTLHELWPKFSQDEKRSVVESIVEKIVLTPDQIDISYCGVGPSTEFTKQQQNLFDLV